MEIPKETIGETLEFALQQGREETLETSFSICDAYTVFLCELGVLLPKWMVKLQ